MSKGKNDPHPIYTLVGERVQALCKASKEIISAVERAMSKINVETDDFVRSGNRTDYNRDGLAFASARIEPLKTGGKALTYSTMEGRRVDDILFAILDDISEEVYPPKDREDGKKNHRRSERDRWLTGLGYVKQQEGKGKRVVFGDAFVEVKAQLEQLIPERFVGTEKPKTALQMLALTPPAGFPAKTFYTNVYRPTAKEEQILIHVQEISAFVKNGWKFQLNKDGEPQGELATFYCDLVSKYLKKEQRARQKAERATEPVEVVPEQTETVEQPIAQAV